MDGIAIKAMMAELAPVIREYVASSLGGIEKRVAELEARPSPERGEPGERGLDGRGIAAADLREGVLVLRLTDESEIEVPGVKGEDGRDGTDGVSPETEAVADALRQMAEEIVSDAVAKGLAELPPPEKGEKGDKGDQGEPGRDGRGYAKSLIDRDGNLVATFTDGTTENLGPVVGKDGAPGKDGADGAPGEKGERGDQGEKGLSGDRGEKGDPGIPFTLDDFDITPKEDGRSIEMRFQRGDVAHVYELCFAVPLDRGVFKQGEVYQPGDGVTWGGSFWIAQRETSAKPDSPDSGFRLSVKRGRDGKDGKDAPK